MQNAKKSITLIIQLPNEISISDHCGEAAGTHSANFDEKVHKPQSKSYGGIGANMHLIFTNTIWI